MNLAEQAPALIIAVPLLASVASLAAGLWRRSLSYPVMVASLAACLLLSLSIMQSVQQDGNISYRLGGWAPPWGIEYAIDHLNAFLALIVSFMGFFGAIYAQAGLGREIPASRIVYFNATYLLFITGLLGITLTGDLFNLFVFLEISSLAGYALIAIGDERSPLASFNYLIMGTIGASFYLLGVGYLYIATGSLNIADLARLLPELYHSRVVLAAFAFFMVGLAIKTALFPLHGWLPGAYSHAPSAVSVVAASTMTKVGAYAMIRVMFTLFEPRFSVELLPVTTVLGWVAAAAMVYGCVLAVAQTDFRRALAYILIAEVGYIIMGVSVANRAGFTGAVLHILNDAFMMACLFMIAGAVVHRTGTGDIRNLRGLHARMPLTMAALVIAALSMVGIPPTAGFFSKWYLLLGAMAAGQWIFAALLLLSSLVIAVVFFRIVQAVYFPPRDNNAPASAAVEAGPRSREEAPASMLFPIYVMVAGILLLGLFSGKIVSSVIQFTIPGGF